MDRKEARLPDRKPRLRPRYFFLAHHDISMTVGTYGHLIPGENRQAVNRLDDTDWSKEKATGASTGKRMGIGKEEGVRLVSLTP